MDTTSAILLRRTKLSDTSLIVTWFTEEHGRVKTVAKGARRPRSAFAGKLDLFYDAEIQFIRSRKSSLHILKEVAVRDSREGLSRDYARVRLASYFVELVELVTEPEHALPGLYDLLQRAFTYLQTQAASRRALLHFESELVRLLGIHGQAKVTPAVAIGRAYGRLPATRPDLVRSLDVTD